MPARIQGRFGNGVFMRKYATTAAAALVMVCATAMAGENMTASGFTKASIPALSQQTGQRTVLKETDFKFPVDVVREGSKVFIELDGVTYQVRALDVDMGIAVAEGKCLQGERATKTDKQLVGANQMGAGEDPCK